MTFVAIQSSFYPNIGEIVDPKCLLGYFLILLCSYNSHFDAEYIKCSVLLRDVPLGGPINNVPI